MSITLIMTNILILIMITKLTESNERNNTEAAVLGSWDL